MLIYWLIIFKIMTNCNTLICCLFNQFIHMDGKCLCYGFNNKRKYMIHYSTGNMLNLWHEYNIL